MTQPCMAVGNPYRMMYFRFPRSTRILRGCSRMDSLLRSSFTATSTTLSTSEITVAMAAPSTSMWNTEMNTISSRMFVSELATRHSSGYRLSPEACRMLTSMLYMTSAADPAK